MQTRLADNNVTQGVFLFLVTKRAVIINGGQEQTHPVTYAKVAFSLSEGALARSEGDAFPLACLRTTLLTGHILSAMKIEFGMRVKPEGSIATDDALVCTDGMLSRFRALSSGGFNKCYWENTKENIAAYLGGKNILDSKTFGLPMLGAPYIDGRMSWT